MGFFDKDKWKKAAETLGKRAGESYEKAWDKTIEAAKTTDEVVGSFVGGFKNASTTSVGLGRPKKVLENLPLRKRVADVPVAREQYPPAEFCKEPNCLSDRVASSEYCAVHLQKGNQLTLLKIVPTTYIKSWNRPNVALHTTVAGITVT